MYWLRNFQESSSQTKYFLLTALIFGAAIVFSTLFAYGRLDYVRSDKALHSTTITEPPK